MNLPVEVISAVRDGRCLVFVGTRASAEAADLAGAAYPEAIDLARSLGWRKPKPQPGAKPARVVIASVAEGAAALEARSGRAALVDALREAVGAPVPPSSAHTALVRRFSLLFTTCLDDLIERAAAGEGIRLDVLGRGDAIPEASAERHVLVKLRGGFERPEGLVLTAADAAARPFSADHRKQLRALLRSHVVLFVGYRPDEEEFERLFDDLSTAWGGELPRCHLAVASGPIDDYLWQKWVWRGLLLFTADPVECAAEIEVGSK